MSEKLSGGAEYCDGQGTAAQRTTLFALRPNRGGVAQDGARGSSRAERGQLRDGCQAHCTRRPSMRRGGDEALQKRPCACGSSEWRDDDPPRISDAVPPFIGQPRVGAGAAGGPSCSCAVELQQRWRWQWGAVSRVSCLMDRVQSMLRVPWCSVGTYLCPCAAR